LKERKSEKYKAREIGEGHVEGSTGVIRATSGIATWEERVPGNVRLLGVLPSTLHPLRLFRFHSARCCRDAESGILIFTPET